MHLLVQAVEDGDLGFAGRGHDCFQMGDGVGCDEGLGETGLCFAAFGDEIVVGVY